LIVALEGRSTGTGDFYKLKHYAGELG